MATDIDSASLSPPKSKKQVPQTIEEYSTSIIHFLTTYTPRYVDECLSNSHYLEAIGSIHIQISEQLRFLITKNLKRYSAIPLDSSDKRYSKLIEVMSNLNFAELCDFTFILGLIDSNEYGDLKSFNTLRNKFSHSYEKRKDYTERSIKTLITKARKIERELSRKMEFYHP